MKQQTVSRRSLRDIRSELERERTRFMEGDPRQHSYAAALSRIENGTYGSCQSCGAAIPYDRLIAIPETLYCINCGPRAAWSLQFQILHTGETEVTHDIVANRLAVPPPLDLDLFDGNIHVGWLRLDAVGFRGFANEAEAMHAAWLAYRTLARRMAQKEGRRPPPIDTEPLALKADDSIHASQRRIAALTRHAASSEGSAPEFGFELEFEQPLDQVAARAMALLIYRGLRRSGVRWSLWRRDTRPERSAADVERAQTSRAVVRESGAWTVATGVAVSIALLIAGFLAPATVGGALVVTGLAGLVALRLFTLHSRWPARGIGRAASWTIE
jgi:hypothetical protein